MAVNFHLLEQVARSRNCGCGRPSSLDKLVRGRFPRTAVTVALRGVRMIVNVGGKQYEIDGGQRATTVWEMIKENGQPLTREMVAKLPDADKRALIEHAQRFLDKDRRPGQRRLSEKVVAPGGRIVPVGSLIR